MLLALVFSAFFLSCGAIREDIRPDSSFWDSLATAPTLYWPVGESPRKIAVIRLNTEITKATSIVFDALLEQAITADAVVVEIDSPGGDAGSAMRIFSSISKFPRPVACVVPRLAASGGFLILQACGARAVLPGAMLMIHEAAFPDDVWNAVYWKELKDINNLMGYFVCRRVNLSNDDCRDRWRGKEWWLTSHESVLYGAADAILPSVQEAVDIMRFPRG
jgi:ATP-dependent protease ClpP protease subunit